MKSSFLARILVSMIFRGALAFNNIRLVFDDVIIDDPLELWIPTLNSSSEKCRDHSRLYLEELKKLTVWATDMFDASSKIPSGIVAGASYDLGNFDECVQVLLPDSYGFSGQYCLADLKIIPFSSDETKISIFPVNKGYEDIFNMSTWDKIQAYGKDRSKAPRDEVHLAFCIPSSCSTADLKNGLQQIIDRLRTALPFGLDVTVTEERCQTVMDSDFNNWDLIFIVVCAIFVGVALFSTMYHLLTKLEDLSQFKCTGNLHQVLTSFSLAHNLKKLATKTKGDDGLECLHGLKVLSMFLIIMGHRVMFMISSPMTNPKFIEDKYQRPEAAVLLNGTIIVNTFFTISGFLATYLLLLEFDRTKRFVNVMLLYIHRFIRLTPAYAIVLAFYCTVFIRVGSGPFWEERVAIEQERCIASWWANLLYVNNYVSIDNICIFQSWYLTCDTHYFLIVPFISYLLWKQPKVGLVCSAMAIATSVIIPFIVIYIKRGDPFLLVYMKFLRDPVSDDTYRFIYIPTHMRASAYLVGIVTGYLKYKMRSTEYKIPKSMLLFGWIFNVLIMGITVYVSFLFYLPDLQDNPLFSALYGAMHHFIWSVFIAWLIIAVSEGHGNWIAPYLRWRPLTVLSRITYTAFLCHGAVQIHSVAILRQPLHTSIYALVSNCASDIVLSYLAGLIVSLFFEAPLVGLEKIILKKGRREPINNKPSVIPEIFIPKIKTIHL